jgi:hypothetical protein
MQELMLTIETTQPTLIGNFDSFTKALDSYTKQFEIEVTSDNIKEAKESGAELNKIKKQVKETAKKYLDDVLVPITKFKAEIAKIEELLETKRLNIASGIAVFEDAKRLEHTQKMNDYIANQLANAVNPLRDEFMRFILIPTASVAGLTSTGELSKKYRDEIDASISSAYDRQHVADMEIENQRLKDEARAKEIADKMRRKEALQYREPVPTPEPILFTPPTPEPTPEPVVTPQGKSIYKITLEFEIQSKSGISIDAMIQKVLPMIFEKQIPISHQKCEEI